MKNEESKTFQQKEISIEQRKWLENKIIEYAMKWEPVMGVHCTGFMIRNMKTRWEAAAFTVKDSNKSSVGSKTRRMYRVCVSA